jgi:nuclear receptor interaction protein
MPYSNDRTIVSATDDVRIFDIEHSGHSALGSASSRRTEDGRRRVGIYGLPDGVMLSQSDTNAKAFRCHTDTVKRIVTEDSPFYFLTCSEDGDVRQWDVRQPARAYPQKDGLVPRWASNDDVSDNVPPPLISYSRYNLDLNTVSCSPSQPHYIALGGAHMHCFLHDRRMLSRDKLAERGATLSSQGNRTLYDEGLLSKATQCVKKFAPNGQQRMGRTDNGHITACKISDANPNELIVSWSGDHIYSFDILRSADATEEVADTEVTEKEPSRRVRDKTRKRKRPKSGALSQDGAERTGSRQRTESSDEGLALRVNYGNGQSEEIRIGLPPRPMSPDRVSALVDTNHFRIAHSTSKLLKLMFDLPDTGPGINADDPASHLAGFNIVLGTANRLLQEIDETSRTWRYPVNPSPIDVALQNTLRDGRAASRRFVQAAGTIARVLGGRLSTRHNANPTNRQNFTLIEPTPGEREVPKHEQFGYDFLKAILAWLDSGLGAVIEAFSGSSRNPRLPIPPDADIDAIDEYLIPYLLQLASEEPVVNVDVSRFESDDTRYLFTSEKAAVVAFSQALKVPFADLIGADATTEDEVQDRTRAIKRWAFKVGRGILLNASRDIRFSSVDRAFGGRGIANTSIQAEEEELRQRQADIDPLEEDAIADTELESQNWQEQAIEWSESAANPILAVEREQNENTLARAETESIIEEDDKEEGDSDGDIDPSDADEDDDENEDPDDDDDADSDGLARTRSGHVLWRSDINRSHLRSRVESHVPCSSHTRIYTGHCNVRTVKDVNFFGQEDEYVVSGSDCGHLFIWDKKTANLINILEGDGEVVNVVQGTNIIPHIPKLG